MPLPLLSTLLLRFQGVQTCVGAEMLAPELANVFLQLQGYQTCDGAGMLAPGLSNAMLVQHFVLELFPAPFDRFRWRTRKAFVLRTDAAFAARWLQG